MIYGHESVVCWCKCCMQWKIFKFRIFIVLYIHFSSSGFRAYYHMIYMLKMLIITRVVIIYINICKCCKYRLLLLLIAIVLIKYVVSCKSLWLNMINKKKNTCYCSALFTVYCSSILFTVYCSSTLFIKKKFFF